jgi:RNA polymerase sigma-70 factor (ECF subfamily)
MTHEASIELVRRWQQGDQRAAAELFHRYAQDLILLAGRQLSARLAQRVAAEDVVQSVYCSFFVGARNGQFSLERSGDLWRLLVAITYHKVQHQLKRHTADKRSYKQEQPISGSDSVLGIPGPVLADKPLPEDAVALADELELIMRQLDPLHRRVFELRLQGYTLDQIAAEVRCCQRTVRRVLERIQQQLQDRHQQSMDGADSSRNSP